jgi:hypothetical protein
VCNAGSVVLFVLFGVCALIPLASAGVNDTFCELGVVTIGATATVAGAVDDVVVAMLAGDVLAMDVTSNAASMELVAGAPQRTCGTTQCKKDEQCCPKDPNRCPPCGPSPSN